MKYKYLYLGILLFNIVYWAYLEYEIENNLSINSQLFLEYFYFYFFEYFYF